MRSSRRRRSVPATSIRPRAAFIHVGHGPGSGNIAGLDPVDAKTRAFDHRADGPVEMTAAGDAAPGRRQPVLPAPHALVGRPSVLDEQQPAARPGPPCPPSRWGAIRNNDHHADGRGNFLELQAVGPDAFVQDSAHRVRRELPLRANLSPSPMRWSSSLSRSSMADERPDFSAASMSQHVRRFDGVGVFLSAAAIASRHEFFPAVVSRRVRATPPWPAGPVASSAHSRSWGRR